MTIEQARINMLKQQVRAGGVLDEAVLALLQATPREKFVPAIYESLAFADLALPLGHGQFMFTPTDEGLILQALQVKATDKVLEVGTGSGYLTALLASKAAQVDSIDICSEFTQQAQQRLTQLHIHNVHFITADVHDVWNKLATYDVIVISAGLPLLSNHWRELLTLGGRLFAILGKAPTMHAICIVRHEQTEWQEQVLFETVVPELINAAQPDKFVF